MVHTINASVRKEHGKVAAKRIRASGKIPAVACNTKGEACSLTVDAVEFSKVWRNITRTTSITLSIEGKEHLAYIQDVEYDIKTDSVLHADFHIVNEDTVLKERFKIQYSGSPQGVREGGFLVKHQPSILLKATPKNMPERIVADISGIRIGEVFRVKDLGLPKDITIITDPEAVLVTVAPPRG